MMCKCYIHGMDENDFFKAAWNNDVATLRRALAEGADPNRQHARAGTLPLQLACQANAIEAIQALLEAGAKADITFTRASRVDNGRVFANHTPLMYAESVPAAKLLIDAGARLESADGLGWTALVKAANAGNTELVRYLIDRGANLDVRPLLEGRPVTLLEFLDSSIDFLTGKMGVPQDNARIRELGEVRALISRCAHDA